MVWIDIEKKMNEGFNTEKTVWDLGNNILYNICNDYFKHINDDEIITKVLFIGRIYAAAIERRVPDKTEIILNEDFYTKKVVPAFKDSEIDFKLERIKNLSLESRNLIQILSVHKYLVEVIKSITNLEKRSFVSKYLHFHLPEIFFIYDTRAVKSIRDRKIAKLPNEFLEIIQNENVDKEYATFFCKCLILKEKIETKFNKKFTTRQIDNLLLRE